MQPQVIVIPARSEVKNNVSQRQLNVAAYCRVSTDDDEQETSFEAQISYYTEKINGSSGWRMAGIFADEGITGTVDTKRPEFLKMIRLCRNRKIDLILTKSISRFARNTVDCLKYVRELKSLGIGVIFEKENIDTMRIDSEMLLTVMSSFAQAESESISKNVSWGIRQSFKSGKVSINYKFMLGYRKGADGKPEIVPDEAEIVKEIFRKYLDGCSQNQIADYLNGMGITTKAGKKWYDITVSNILTNEKYTGDAILQKTYVLDCISKKRCVNNGELPKYLVKGHHEAIISHSEFDRVQAEMARRKSKRKIAEKLTKTENGKYSAKFALSELLICGECGTPYRRVTWTAKGFKEIKWRCVSRLQYGKKYCHNSPTIAEETLHRAIVESINNFCEVQSEVSETLRESLTEVLDPTLNGSVKAAQERISELSRNIDELIKLAAGGDTEQSMVDIQKFSNEMTALREFIEFEKAKQSAAEKDNRQLETVLDMLEKENFRLTEYDDVAVRHLIEYIKVIDKNTLLICFKGGFEVRKELNIGN